MTSKKNGCITSNKTFKINKKTKLRAYIVLFCSVVMMLCMPVQRVYAYESWITNAHADDMYGELEAQDKIAEIENSEEDAHSHILLNFLIKIPDGIANALQGSSNSQYNFSIDGIILGRLAEGTTVNFTGFDFGSNNPWSSVGAVIYKCLRNACFTFMMYAYLVIILKNVVNTGERSRTYLKEYLSTFIFLFVLMYCMPQVLDMILYWRDVVLKSIYDGLYTSGIASSTSTSIIEEYRNVATNNMTVWNVLLYLGAAISTIWYLQSYILIAVIQTMLFGIFPLIAVLSIFNKKLLNDWLWMFIGNVLTPFLDYVILLMPVVIENTITAGNGLKFIVKIVMIMSAIPARNAVLKLISMYAGASAGGGFGALAGLGMAAASAVKGAMKNPTRNSGDTANRESTATAESSENADLSSEFNNEFGKNNEEFGIRTENTNGNAGQGDDESTSAYERSQEAIDDMVNNDENSVQQPVDETDTTGQTDEGEPDVPEYEGDGTEGNEDDYEPYDQTGAPDEVFESEPMPENGEMDSEDVSDMNSDVQTQITAEKMSTESEGNTPEGADYLPENGQGTDTDTDTSGSSKRGQGADIDSNASGLSKQPDMPTIDGATKENSKDTPDYNESSSLKNFNDARFANLQNLDGANERLSNLKSRESDLKADCAKKEAAYHDAKDELNNIRQETNKSVSDANHEVARTSNNLQNAVHEQAEATEHKAAIDNNPSASHEQRAAADARLNLANQNVRNAREESAAAMEKQKIAVNERNEKVKVATDKMKDCKKASDNAQKRVSSNANGQRVENAKIMKAKQLEERFKNASQSYGMGNRSYNNASDFERQRKVDGKQRALANYKNFDSGNFKNILSPEERSSFQRQRELKANRDKKFDMARDVLTGNVGSAVKDADTTAGKVAAGSAAAAMKGAQVALQVGAAVAGATVGSFGGTGGATAGAMLGSTIAGKNKDLINVGADAAHGINHHEKLSDRSSKNQEGGSEVVGADVVEKKTVKKTTVQRSTNAKKVITQNAQNAKNDPDINNILR